MWRLWSRMNSPSVRRHKYLVHTRKQELQERRKEVNSNITSSGVLLGIARTWIEIQTKTEKVRNNIYSRGSNI